MSFYWTGTRAPRHYGRVTAFIALLACWFAGMPAWGVMVERVDIGRDRVVLHFDPAAAAAAGFLLTAPGRIGSGGGDTARPVRAAGGDGTHVVFDLTRPAVRTEGVFGIGGRDLAFELHTVDEAAFARAAAERRPGALPPFNLGTAPVQAVRYQLSRPVPAATRGLPLPRVYGDASRPLVVIDAGHGGIDPGAINQVTGLREKDVTLRIARAIRDQLIASGRVRVALTREDDRYLILQERYGIARRLHADLFISIHCDSVGAGDATGASVYTLSEVASDREAARLAARENRSDIIAGVNLGDENADVSSILIDLTQRETMNSSATFARLLGREAQGLVPMKPNFHRMASLMVLKAPDMPSILFETGYISNPRDAGFIDSDEGRHRIAQAIERAVEVHFARRMAVN